MNTELGFEFASPDTNLWTIDIASLGCDAFEC